MIVLDVADVAIQSAAGPIVHTVSFQLAAGEILVMMGESGSGKTLVAQAVMGTLPANLSMTGTVVIGGERNPDRQPLWGRQVALLPQEPWEALDPTMRADRQVALGAHQVAKHPWPAALKLARSALDRLGLARAAHRYPFQLSGGMAQRVAFAATTLADAALLIADEPTKGLDAARRDDIAHQMRMAAERGGAVLVITHDIAFARQLGGQMLVMLDGKIIEAGATNDVLTRPSHPYTRALLAADPASWQAAPTTSGQPVIEGRSLTCRRGGATLFDGLDVTVGSGEIVAVAGPSGCGKTSLGNILLGLMAADAGHVARMPAPATRFQKLYQDPIAAFAPGLTLRRALNDLCHRHGIAWARADHLLSSMGVDASLLDRVPGAVSGGELQRVALVRALLLEPVFLFADEATSRLDPITQADVMQLLRRLAWEKTMGILLVTHDPALARGMAARQIGLAANS